MTREELIDAIDRQIVTAPPFALGGYTMFLHALRAVVELHKPVEDNRCEACYREEYFGGKHLEIGKYPCSTIQAIEKELG